MTAIRILCALIGRLLASSRPPRPRRRERVWYGHPGWITDRATGIWIWNPFPETYLSARWNAGRDEAGRAAGYGCLTWQLANGEDRYEGNMERGICAGEGRMLYHDGHRYDGGWRDGAFDGHGSLILAGLLSMIDWITWLASSGGRERGHAICEATCSPSMVRSENGEARPRQNLLEAANQIGNGSRDAV